MNVREKLLERENECFGFLNAIPEEAKYVLIGGYAVSSYGFPRFSVDLDIVIPQGELKTFERLVSERGYTLAAERKGLDEVYSGEFRSYAKKSALPVSVDLLINSVKSRQTGSSYSFQHLIDNSEVRVLGGWHPTSKASVKVADREMLIALKINSMRLTDKRDVIMLCYTKPDVTRIISHLERCPKDIVKRHLVDLSSMIDDPRYIDSVKGEFSITDKVFEAATRSAKKTVNELLAGIEAKTGS